MLRLFRGSSVAGTLFLLLLFIGFRLPAEWIGVPILPIEIKYLALGEKMAQGKWMYLDIWDNTPILPAFLYGFLHFLFGKTTLPYHLLAFFLVFLQAISWNQWLLRTRMYHERNQLTAFVYLVLASLYWDSFTLTPEILANTFLILALGNLLLHLNEQYHYQKGFDIGVYLGLAMLCYVPSIFWIVGVLFVFLAFSSTQIREYVLLCLGALLPVTLVGIIFYFRDGLEQFIAFFIVSNLGISKTYHLSLLQFALFLFMPALLSVWGVLLLLQGGSFTNYQTRSQQAFVFMLIFGLVGIFFQEEISIYSLAPLWAVMSFFITHLLWLLASKWFKEILLVVFCVIGIGVNYVFLLEKIPFAWQKYISNVKRVIIPEVKGEKIWFLGKQWEYYLHNQLATPYFHYELSERHLKYLDYYDVQAEVYDKIEQDLPTLIAGNRALITKLFQRLPGLAQRYEYQSEKGWWKLKK